MLKYIKPELVISEFDVEDILTNSSVVTTAPANIGMGGTGGDGYIDIEDIL